MADRRKSRRKKEQDIKDEDTKPSKSEYAIAKYLRDKLPLKKTTLLSHKVEYFIASKAVDCLMESQWASSKKECIFTNRESVVEYLDMMLRHKFFHRARKIIVQKDNKKKKDTKDEDESANDDDKKEPKKEDKQLQKKKEKRNKDEKDDPKETKKDETTEKKKEKKKIKLDMHLEQLFVDGNEAFVWIYDPIPVRAWVIGTLLVIGAVMICLFPLWPKTVRHYVYYLSVAAAGFLVVIIALAVLRLVVFVLVWVFSLGNHHLWLLPNLTEDVGFLESFWPLYKYKYKGIKDDGNKKKKKNIEESFCSGATIDFNYENKNASYENCAGSEQDNKVDHQASEDSDQGSEKNSQESFEILTCEDLKDDESKDLSWGTTKLGGKKEQ